MLTQERQNLIENYLDQHELCRVNELCRITATSESTIRRDLIQMEKQGLLKRVYGGAQSIKKFSRDVSQYIRFQLNHQEKVAVARYAAANLVGENDYIFLDAGTTVYEMASFLPDLNITVVTTGVETALGCIGQGIETLLVGGKIKDDTHAIVGQTAASQLNAMNFAVSFVGTNGIKSNGDLTTPDPEEAAIKRLVIAHSDQAYVLTDSSKLGESNFAVFENVKNVVVITNELTSSQKKLLPAQINLKEVK